MSKKLVLQEHGFGCGVACVAYTLGITYPEALTLFAEPEFAWTQGYVCKDLVNALARGGLDYCHFYFRARHRKFLKLAGVIVFTKRSKRYPAGHYVVRGRQGWMNSWANCPIIHPVRGEIQKRLVDPVGYILIPGKYLSSVH